MSSSSDGSHSGASGDFYRSLLDSVSDGVYFVDRGRRISYWNPAAERISGYSAGEMIGHRCPEGRLLHCDASGKILCQDGCPLEAVLSGNQPESCQVFMRCKNGSRLPVIVSASPVLNEEGLVVGVAEVFRDHSASLSAIEQATRASGDAYLDPLTELGNRRLAEMRIPQLLQLARSPKRPGALLFVDVDHFKAVNDTFGHLAGDEVLKTVARTLRHTLRTMDVVCRWGGEEFVIFLAAVNDAQVLEVAERCRVLVANSSCSFDDQSISVTCSIGAALVCAGDTLESLVVRADKCMYAAKRNGRNRVVLSRHAEPGSAGIAETASVSCNGIQTSGAPAGNGNPYRGNGRYGASYSRDSRNGGASPRASLHGAGER